MPFSTAPGSSTEVANETQNARKRTASEFSDDGREAKKVKVESERAGLSSKLKAKGEKDKRKKKKRRKTRRSSVVMVEASKPRPTTAQPASAPQASSSDVKPAIDAADAEPEEKIISSVDKGKAKAMSPESGPSRVASPSIQPEASTSTAHYASEIARLKEQVASQAELIQRHETHINASQQSLTCQICLDLLYKPYALAPCGHITCYGCLVRWFTAPANPAEAQIQGQPVEEILSSTLARNGAYLRRKKSCPVCRANILERPAELWDIKSMVQALVRSKLVEIPATAEEPAPAGEAATSTHAMGASNTNANNDPWRNVFQPVRPARAGGALGGFGFDFFMPHHMGLHDAEDGGIYRCIDCHNEILDGECTGCGREYAGHLDGGDTEHSSDEEDDDGWHNNARLRALLEEHDDEDDLDDEDDPDYPDFVPAHFWGGGNPIFHLPDGDDLTDEGDDDDDDDDDLRYDRIFEVATDVDEGEEDGSDHRIYEVEDEDGSEHGHEDDENSQYGGSFIDDDELVEIVGNDRMPSEDGSDEEVEFVQSLGGPLRTDARRPIVVASDDNEEADTELTDHYDEDEEEEEEEEVVLRQWPAFRRTRIRPIAIDDTDEDEEE